MPLLSSDKNEAAIAASAEEQQDTLDSTEQPVYPTAWRLVMILLSLTLGTLLIAIDTTVISAATPKISTEFKALNDVGWYGSAYLITLTAFQPISGTFYKLFHPTAVYVVSIVLFEAGSALCAAAPSSQAFIGGRAIAGVGAAGLLQGALGIITYIAPLQKRPLYMAIVISVFGISLCVGPVLGGVLTDRVSWRWCFYINIPIGGVVLVLVLIFLKLQVIDRTNRDLPLRTKLQRTDPVGIILLIGAVCCFFLALQQGGHEFRWKSARIIGLFVGFGLLCVIFGAVQWKLGEHATIPLRFLRQRTVLMGSLFLFCINMSNYIKIYYLPFYFQAVRGTLAMKSGVDTISLALPELVAIVASGALVTKFGYYIPFIIVGEMICAVGTGLLTTININTSTVSWAAFMVLTGFGLGMGINAPHTAIQAVMESETDVFIANGVATFFSQLGGSIGVSIAASILVNTLITEVPKHTDTVSSQDVIGVGPLNLTTLTSSPIVLQGLRESYAKAISNILILALAVVCVSIPMACSMEWLDLKKVSRARGKKNMEGLSSEHGQELPANLTDSGKE